MLRTQHKECGQRNISDGKNSSEAYNYQSTEMSNAAKLETEELQFASNITRHRNVNDSSMLQPETSLSNGLDRVGFRCDAYWRGRMTKYPIEQALGTLIEIAVCSQRRQPCKCLSKVSAATSSVKR